jgi:transcriptional regulator with XRE-family HTH domain
MNKLSPHAGNYFGCTQFYPQSPEIDLDSRLKSLAERIIDRLKERGISRFEFANMMDVQPSIVTRWLSGKHNFTVTTLFAIEHTLGINVFEACRHTSFSYTSLQLTVYSPVTTLINSNELIGALNLLPKINNLELEDSRHNFNTGCTHTRAYLHTPTIHINKFISEKRDDKY